MEFGEVYKLVADSNYTRLFFNDGKRQIITKTLSKTIEISDQCFFRINRKEAVNKKNIFQTDNDFVTLNNGEKIYFSRRRKMKTNILILIFLTLANISFAQTPQNKSTTTKKVVKIEGKFFIEETTTLTQYTEINNEILFSVENDDFDADQEISEKAAFEKQAAEKKAERQLRNKLLKEAMSKGYKPEPRTLEEKERIEKIKAKLK